MAQTEKQNGLLDGVPSFVRAIYEPEKDGAGLIGYDAWAVTPTGHAETDRALGDQYARDAIAFAKRAENPAIVREVLLGMVRKLALIGIDLGPIEEGFIARIAQVALNGSLN